MAKICVMCDKWFSWQDYGSERKYNRMEICPTCEHELDVAFEESGKDTALIRKSNVG